MYQYFEKQIGNKNPSDGKLSMLVSLLITKAAAKHTTE